MWEVSWKDQWPMSYRVLPSIQSLGSSRLTLGHPATKAHFPSPLSPTQNSCHPLFETRGSFHFRREWAAWIAPANSHFVSNDNFMFQHGCGGKIWMSGAMVRGCEGNAALGPFISMQHRPLIDLSWEGHVTVAKGNHTEHISMLTISADLQRDLFWGLRHSGLFSPPSPAFIICLNGKPIARTSPAVRQRSIRGTFCRATDDYLQPIRGMDVR